MIAKFVQELPVDVFTDDWVMFFDGLLAPLQKCINGLFAFQDDEVGKLPLKGGIALSTEVFGSTKTACRIDTTTIMKIGTTIFSLVFTSTKPECLSCHYSRPEGLSKPFLGNRFKW